jgi:hypothetical protein
MVRCVVRLFLLGPIALALATSLRRQRVPVMSQKEKPENMKVANMFPECVDGSGSHDVSRGATK